MILEKSGYTIFLVGIFILFLALYRNVCIQRSHDKYIEGYSNAIDNVVSALVDSNNVVIGNVVDANYTEHCTFFVMDPNRICVESRRTVEPVSITYCTEDEFRLSARFP